MTRFLGIDLAWGAGTAVRRARETGVAVIDETGTVLHAGWAVGVEEVREWVIRWILPGAVIAIDAPLVVTNPTGQRLCEKQVGQRYMSPWKVAANSSNLAKADLAGVTLRRMLEADGIRYTDGIRVDDGESVNGGDSGSAAVGPAPLMFECYPFTTLVGAPEFGYDVRPRYKRFARAVEPSDRRRLRASECDDLLERMSRLDQARPPVRLRSNPVTRDLLDTPSPLDDRAYKHREDLLDAVLCAWTAALWAVGGPGRVQILGADDTPDADGRIPTIVAPTKPEQRR